MKKIRKIIVLYTFIVLIVPCLFLFSGCTLGLKVYENNGPYYRYYDEYTPSEENWELVEEVGDGAVYEYIGGDAEISNKLILKSVDEAELEIYLNEYQDGFGMKEFLKYVVSYEIYNNVHILYFEIENELNFAYAQVIDGVLNIEDSSVHTLEDARAEIDAYLESEQGFIQYFGSNMLVYN